MRWLVEALANPATIHNSEQMEAVGLRLFEEAAKHAAAHPSPDAELQAALEARLAAMDWAGAVESNGLLLARCRERGDHPAAFQAARQASGLHRLLGNPAAACLAAHEATEAARNVPNMDVLVGHALQNEATCLLAAGEAEPALRLAEEALVRIGTESYAETARAGALVVRARCRLGLGDLSGCEADQDTALGLLAPLADSAFFAGIQASLGSLFSTRALWHQARGEGAEACEAQSAAVERFRNLSLAPQIGFDVAGPHLARSLRDLARLLAETGRDEETEPVLAEYRTLLGRLRLPDLPRSY
jgi:hypothetical protein